MGSDRAYYIVCPGSVYLITFVFPVFQIRKKRDPLSSEGRGFRLFVKTKADKTCGVVKEDNVLIFGCQN